MASLRTRLFTNRFFLFPAVLFVLFLPTAQCLSVQTPPADSCFVYPSPASGDTAWAVYNMPSPGTALVIVYGESGDMVSQVREIKSSGLQQTGLDLFYYRKGVYFCRIILTLDTGAKKKLKTFKFVVAK